MKSIVLTLLIATLLPLDARGASVSFTEANRAKKIKVEIAKTESERARGLMFRASLAENQGMWFDFPDDKVRVFWMKNVRFPIDIIFIDKDFFIRKIWNSAPPCYAVPCPRYFSGSKVRYALEAPAGFCESNGIKEKQRIIFRP